LYDIFKSRYFCFSLEQSVIFIERKKATFYERFFMQLKMKWLFVLAIQSLILLTLCSDEFPNDMCESFEEGSKGSLLMGETIPVPFASQLLSIFSYPVSAFIFETDLVLGPVYSKIRSGGKSSLFRAFDFEHFFDLNHFREYWSHHKLKVLTWKEYSSCLNYSVVKINRIPEFLALPKFQYYGIFRANNITKPFPKKQLFRFVNDYKMVALYSFWKDIATLKYTHASLHPAPLIHLFATSIIHSLPKDYVAAHIRLDEKELNLTVPGYPHEHAVQIINTKIVKYLEASECLKNYLMTEISPPVVYLTVTYSSKISSDKRMLRTLFDLLKKSNAFKFHTHRMKIREENQEKVNFKSFTSEQLAYADLLVSKNSRCFIPSPVPSTTSYMIKRLQLFDRGLFEPYEYVNKTSYGQYHFYREWGL
jgi:hypothetical protein